MLQQTPVKSHVQGAVPISSPRNSAVTFPMGLPKAQLNCLSERKSFRANIKSLTTSSPDERPVYLCLKCRQAGHIMEACPYPVYPTPRNWIIAEPNNIYDLTKYANQLLPKICERCEKLCISDNHHGWPLEEFLERTDDYEQLEQFSSWTTLGPAAKILFRTDCAFCRLLFSITKCPPDGTQEIILTDAPTITRLGVHQNTFAELWAASVYTTTMPTKDNWKNYEQQVENSCHMAVSGMTYVSEDFHKRFKRSLPLGGRHVNPFSFDESIIRRWLKRCEDFHNPVCNPDYSEELQHIRLLDVFSREIVQYPKCGCDYIALSYVWGKVDQKSYKLGSIVGDVPQTIEDAISVVIMLGKKFLWVDSLTIDQSDSAHKEAQIKLMGAVYSGAWATIVALSGNDSNSGLPRVARTKNTHPHVSFRQLSATHSGVQIVSTMPTLDQQMRVSLWASRAWTLQEGLLSKRCLFFSQHQVYFQCNTFQCCEAIDDSRSLPHNEISPLPSNFGNGVLQNHFLRPFKEFFDEESEEDMHSEEELGLTKFYELLSIYSERKMSEATDKINAFSAILQELESRFLGVRDFHYGMPFSQQVIPLYWEARGQAKRLKAYPSWSWAGWETHVYTTLPGFFSGKAYQSYLLILKPQDDSVRQITYLSPLDGPGGEWRRHSLKSDSLLDLAKQHSKQPNFSRDQILEGDISGHLFIEGIFLSFPCPSPSTGQTPIALYNLTSIYLGDMRCHFRYREDIEYTLSERAGKTQNFLVLARDWEPDRMLYYLLFLDEVDGIAYRIDIVMLYVPHAHQSYIDYANPQRKWLILG